MTLLLVGSAAAQYITVGPPDDPTVIDTSYHPAPPPPSRNIPLSALSAGSVSSIDLSQLDCSGFPNICLYVDALDGLGNPVAGLTKDSFCLYQDGTPINTFTVQQLSAGNCITNVCLVVDVSGSMADSHKLDSAKAAMHRFVNNMDVYDQVAIVTFSNCWTVLQTFTSNKTTLNNAINTIVASGNTAAFDGIWKGVDITRLQLGSKAVIAFTDGLENRSQSCSPNPPDGVSDNMYSDDSTTICNLANSASLPIYTFNLGPIDTTWYNPAAMKAFATGTGGSWSHAPTGAQIDSLYSKIKQRLCSRYYICYTSGDTVQNGDIHWTKVCKKTGPTCSPCDSSSCQEKAAPKIVRTPATINLGNSCQSTTSPASICAFVTDKDTPKAALVVNLFYRTGPSSYTQIAMTATGPSGDSTFCASIPVSALKCQNFVDYYITASDSSFTVSAPAVNPQVSPYNFTLCPNHAPVANAGANINVFQCAAAQICLPASCSDIDGNLQSCQLVSGPGTYNGTNICFTPTGTLNYEFVIKATDSCGATGYDTVVVFYTLNSAPVANAGPDSTLFLCAAQQICWPASCSDPNNNLLSGQLISGTGTYNGSSICFTPASSGTYQFILKATDSCGLTKQDTAVINVTINSAPVCHVPNDTTITQCIPSQVCLPVSATDVNGNFKVCQIMSGPGSLVSGNWCYTPSATQDAVVTIKCEDSCGAFCQSTFTVHFIVNPAPVVAFGNDTTIFQCTAAQICLPYTVTDGNSNVTTEQLLSGPGTIDTVNNRVCFTPAASGTYTFVVKATDACTATGQDSIKVTVNLNHAPVASAGPDQTIFQCTPTQICWAASSSDVDNNLDSSKLVAGPGTFNGSQICFTPAVSGIYTFVIRAVDHCGVASQDTATVTVTVNGTPSIAFGADTTLFLCAAQPVCMNYTVSDPNGMSKLTEAMVSGFGSIDTTTNKVCFTPAATGSYQFIVSVTDSCGASKRDTINANITIGVPAAITCPGGPITKFLCTAGPICEPLTITPAGATVTTSFGTYSGGNLCFQADTTGTYHIRVIAATTCKTDTCNLTFNVTLNHAPVASAGPDQTIFQCTPTQICWPASCSDVDNNLDSCKLISGSGTYNGSSICFTPASSGLYTFVLRAVDQCGRSSQDTVKVTVTINGAPTVAFGADTTLFLCTPQQVCMNYTLSDPNGLGKLTETMVSGPGAIDTANNKVCFTPSTTGTYQFIVSVTDSCGASKRDTINANITFGIPAAITCPSGTITKFLCTAGQICEPLTITPAGATVTTSFGTYSGGNLCFQADSTGTYHIRVIATTACKVDTCNVTFAVTINQAPVANAGPDQTVFQCTPTQICWPVSCTDPDNNLDSCKLISGPGTYNGSNICFTTSVSGVNTFVLRAVDQCGRSSQDTVKVTVTINGAPTIAFGADTTLFLCAAQQICMNYTVSDPNGLGKLTEAMVSGFGSIDTANNKICFTPSTTGNYQFIVSVTDSCGASKRDTINANVTFGALAHINCLAAPVNVSLCATGSVCQALTITPGAATVTTSFGTYSGGNLCFQADTSGTYHIRVIAATTCNADTCNLTFNVSIGTAAQVSCPAPMTKFLCNPGPISVPVGIVAPGGTVTVTPIGTYSSGNLTFNADTTGHYVIKIKAVTSCGSDSCQVIADVSFDAPPVAVNPATPKDTFMCASAQVCYQFAASDPNGGALTWTKLSGVGAISTGGQWCFTPSTTGSYAITAVVSDSCGKADTTTLTYNITLNRTPAVHLGVDTTILVCNGGSVCLPYTVSDADNNLTLEQLTSGPGTIDTVNNKVCFTPASAGLYTFIVKAQDACASAAFDTINVVIGTGTSPTVSCPGVQTKFLCAPTSVCVPVTIGGSSPTVTVTPIGSYSAGQVCFQADTTGHYVLKVKAVNSCGADSCTITANITINSAPIAVNPATPKDTFMCASAQVCYQFSASDPNGGILNWSKLTGAGTITAGGLWCFTPGTSGAYAITAVVADSCGKADTTTLTYNIALNHAPVVHLGADTTILVCNGGSICLPYTVSDADNNLTLEQLTSGPGTIDTVNNKVCFTPATPGLYTFIVKATDVCAATTSDTINVTIATGTSPVISCPGVQTKFLCASSSVCVPITVSGSTPTVTVTPIGSYSAGSVCFTADTTGHYVLKVKVTNSCGADSCTITANITINSRPVAVNPTTPKDTFICVASPICYQFSASDVNGGTLTWSKLSGTGTITAGGLWCFTPAGSGTYSAVAVVADSCGGADTTTLVYNITQNIAPTVSLGVDQNKPLCGPAQICVNYTVTDPNNNITSEQLLSGPGTIDTVANKICYTPSVSGTSTFIVKVTDACGAVAQDTVNVTVTMNLPPVVNAGTDASTFQCTATQICYPITVSDPNGNLDSVKLVSGTGTIVNNAGSRSICFTPPATGIYTFIVRVVDSCGASAQDTVKYTVTINSAPVCQTPHDTTTYFQCTPTQVSLPVSATDVDNNFNHCELVSGPGSIVAGQWVYTPSTSEFRKIVVKCLDVCGAYCTDSFYVRFKLNAPPVVNAGKDTTYFFCNASQICLNTSASDPDGNLASVMLYSGPGTYNPTTHQICATVDPAQGLTQNLVFILRAADTCNVFSFDTAKVTVNFNHAPTIQAPPDFTAYMEQGGPLCFDLTIFDVDANLDSIKVTPFGTYNPQTAQLCFQADTSGVYCVTVTAKDRCGVSTVDTICIEVAIDECLHVQIEKTHNAIQGQIKPVNIFLNGSGKKLGGFNLLIAYDASALTPLGVNPGPLFTGCGWEYFTYRMGANGNCGSGCPSGLLRITGIAETNNGAYHPTCYFDGGVGSLALINFLVTNDRTMECQFSPINFYWLACGDNGFSSIAGDTLWISRRVLDFELHDITQTNTTFPSYVGAPDQCLIGGVPGKPGPQRCIDFTNGGVDIICADSIDARGDVNLNSVGYEIADAVMFSNYFIYGLPAFGNNSQKQQGSIAATDVNADGLALTVADLVYLIRVIVGDAIPYPKIVPGAEPVAQFDLANGVLEISRTDAPIGAISMVLEGDAHPRLHESVSSMELKYHFDGVNTRVLISDMSGKASLKEGPVMYLTDAKGIKTLEAGTYDGAVVNAKLHALPTSYVLSQNYPNPFNPVTRIEFGLPTAGKWNLTIFNILGQEVTNFSGENAAGYYKVDWDASKYSSGVYLYRLTAGSFKATKKMVLLK